MVAVLAAILSVVTGRPVDASRWADVVERWQEHSYVPEDPPAEAWAALMRAMLCRRGVEQMRADADEAARMFAAGGLVNPTPALLQGIARVLCGDPDGGDAAFQDALGVEDGVGAPEDFAVALCERSLVAMARNEWDSAEVHASQARTVLRRAGIEESFTTPLVCAVHARTALHREDRQAARQELVIAQRSRSLLTYALPHIAVQARTELARVHLALADPAGARTLLREIDELFRRRSGLGILGHQADALRDQLAKDRGSAVPGASALTAAELRLLPLLATHLSFPQIGEELFLSRNTIKSQAVSIYRKLGVDARSPAVARARDLGLLEG
jgi:LuxR family maltose regulon positive regulatory protein